MRKMTPAKLLAIYIGLYALLFILQYVMVRLLGMPTETVGEVLRINSISNLIFYGGGVILLISMFYVYWKEQIKAFFANLRQHIGIIVAGFGVMLFVSSLAGIILTLLGVTDTSENQEILNVFVTDGELFDQIAFLLFAVIGAPIVEEVVFRKGIFDFLKRFNIHPALMIIASALIFGYIHVLGDDIAQIVTYAFLGGVLGSVYYFAKENVLPSIIIHMVFNGMVAVSMFQIAFS